MASRGNAMAAYMARRFPRYHLYRVRDAARSLLEAGDLCGLGRKMLPIIEGFLGAGGRRNPAKRRHTDGRRRRVLKDLVDLRTKGEASTI